jgi:hypothetical protein
MKSIVFKPWLLFLFISVLFSGCELLDEADDVEFTTDFTLPDAFEVDEHADDPANPYMSLTSTIDAEQDPDYLKYKSKVKDIVVNEIKYTISDFSAPGGAVILTSGEAIFFASGQTAASGVVASVENLPLANGSGILQASPAALETIADIILQDGEIVVQSVVNLSDAPCAFKVKVTLNVTVTANALD